ncbi:hypothetical protein V7183_24225 [Bacillus sp. JJ1127]
MTIREPEDRVEELLPATGVPTSFILVCKQFTEYCLLSGKNDA